MVKRLAWAALSSTLLALCVSPAQSQVDVAFGLAATSSLTANSDMRTIATAAQDPGLVDLKVAIAAGISSAVTADQFTLSAASTVWNQCGSAPSAPSQATAYGYTSLVFCEDFSQPTVVDSNDTKGANFSFYVVLQYAVAALYTGNRTLFGQQRPRDHMRGATK